MIRFKRREADHPSGVGFLKQERRGLYLLGGRGLLFAASLEPDSTTILLAANTASSKSGNIWVQHNRFPGEVPLATLLYGQETAKLSNPCFLFGLRQQSLNFLDVPFHRLGYGC